MSQDTTKILRAADRLAEAFETHKAATLELDIAREKLNKLERQTAEILTKIFGDVHAGSNSIIIGYQHRFRTLKKTLTRSKNQIGKSRDRLEQTLDDFGDTMSTYNALLAEHSAAVTAERQVTAASQRVLSGLIGQLVAERQEETEHLPDEIPDVSHGYIPYPVPQFLELLLRVDLHLSNDPDFDDPEEKYRPVRFLEIGAGRGRNMMMAKLSKLLLIESVAGFDINEAMVEQGRLAFGLQDELSVADALTFDYGGQDVMFSYRPIRVPEIQSQLEEQIVATMDKGAYLLAPMAEDLARYDTMERVGYPFDIWKKVR